MSRLKILSWKDAQPTFYQLWWQPFVEPYFELIWLDNNTNNYNPKNSVVIIRRPYINNWQQKITDYRNQGYKVIFDDLWELPVDSTITDGVMTLRSKNFFRINECLWWQYLNFDQYCPSLQKSKKFLLLMRLIKTHRDRIYQRFAPILNQSVYSYVARGKLLENDAPELNINWQRHFDPTWYNSTYFSVVAESLMQPMTFVTEKTYKPLAYYHPFVVFGTSGTLAHVRGQGFETFGHIIDESYDSELIVNRRFNQVCNIVFDLVKQLENDANLFQDPITQQKLQHNHATFFNTTLAKQMFCDDIFTQILNFIETL
jgi:hypothetical protein